MQITEDNAFKKLLGGAINTVAGTGNETVDKLQDIGQSVGSQFGTFNNTIEDNEERALSLTKSKLINSNIPFKKVGFADFGDGRKRLAVVTPKGKVIDIMDAPFAKQVLRYPVDNPLEAAADVATMFIPGANLAKGASIGAKLAKIGGDALKLGSASAVGSYTDSKAEGSSDKQALLNALDSGLITAGGTAAIDTALPLVKSIAKGLTPNIGGFKDRIDALPSDELKKLANQKGSLVEAVKNHIENLTPNFTNKNIQAAVKTVLDLSNNDDKLVRVNKFAKEILKDENYKYKNDTKQVAKDIDKAISLDKSNSLLAKAQKILQEINDSDVPLAKAISKDLRFKHAEKAAFDERLANKNAEFENLIIGDSLDDGLEQAFKNDRIRKLARKAIVSNDTSELLAKEDGKLIFNELNPYKNKEEELLRALKNRLEESDILIADKADNALKQTHAQFASESKQAYKKVMRDIGKKLEDKELGISPEDYKEFADSLHGATPDGKGNKGFISMWLNSAFKGKQDDTGAIFLEFKDLKKMRKDINKALRNLESEKKEYSQDYQNLVKTKDFFDKHTYEFMKANGLDKKYRQGLKEYTHYGNTKNSSFGETFEKNPDISRYDRIDYLKKSLIDKEVDGIQSNSAREHLKKMYENPKHKDKAIATELNLIRLMYSKHKIITGGKYNVNLESFIKEINHLGFVSKEATQTARSIKDYYKANAGIFSLSKSLQDISEQYMGEGIGHDLLGRLKVRLASRLMKTMRKFFPGFLGGDFASLKENIYNQTLKDANMMEEGVMDIILEFITGKKNYVIQKSEALKQTIKDKGFVSDISKLVKDIINLNILDLESKKKLLKAVGVIAKANGLVLKPAIAQTYVKEKEKDDK